MPTDVLVAIEGFTTETLGYPRSVRAGETFEEGHPITTAHPGAFREFTVDNPVEVATAVPGEKRATRRGKTKTTGAAED